MTIRTATLADLPALAAVEAACFPVAEAATEAELRDRLTHYADHFWLLLDGDRLVSFVDGMVTDQADLKWFLFHTNHLIVFLRSGILHL